MKPFDVATADRIPVGDLVGPPAPPANWPTTQVEPKPDHQGTLTETPDSAPTDPVLGSPLSRAMLTASHPDVFAIKSFLDLLEGTADVSPDLMAMPGVAVLYEHCQAVAVIDGLKRGLVRE